MGCGMWVSFWLLQSSVQVTLSIWPASYCFHHLTLDLPIVHRKHISSSYYGSHSTRFWMRNLKSSNEFTSLHVWILSDVSGTLERKPQKLLAKHYFALWQTCLATTSGNRILMGTRNLPRFFPRLFSLSSFKHLFARTLECVVNSCGSYSWKI